MRGWTQLLVVVCIFLLCGGLSVVVVDRARGLAAQMQCQDNLKWTGQALHNYQDTHGHFPPATFPQPKLVPEKRFSWLARIGPYYEGTNLYRGRDWLAAWDAPPNVSLATDRYRPHECPRGPDTFTLDGYYSTHYLGIAGLGADAASLPITHPRAGFFGDDRKLSSKDIRGNTSTLLVVLESQRIHGAWTAEGDATVRGLDSDDPPYLGRGAQFGGMHRQVTNALFADGSVRPLRSSIDAKILEAIATLAGRDGVSVSDF